MPSWALCNNLAEVAIQNDNSKLTFLALGFMVRWIQQSESGRPPVFLSVDEGLVISALATAARTFDSVLLDASWAILKRSLRDKAVPKPETYLAKINALASMGSLPNAFSTLSELERKHESSVVAKEDLLSPFTSLYPLVVACSKHGFETLDLVSVQFYLLEFLIFRQYSGASNFFCLFFWHVLSNGNKFEQNMVGTKKHNCCIHLGYSSSSSTQNPVCKQNLGMGR